MSSRDDRNEYGQKNKIFIKINGKCISRAFRNEGEARRYLTAEGFTKEDLRKGIVKIMRN